MRKITSILYLSMLFMLSACYNSGDSIEETVSSSKKCLTDTSLYLVFIYHPNGEICRTGFIQNGKKMYDWEEYYSDGTLKRKIYFFNDIIYHNGQSPKIDYYEDDSLKVGIMTKVRTLNLYPNERLRFSKNLKITESEDRSEYDFGVTPLTDDTAYFYYIEEGRKETSEPKSKLLEKSPVYK